MRFLDRDDVKKKFRVRVDSIDDLWYLHQAVPECTIVGSHTFRKLEAKDDLVRADNQPRIKIYLRIRVEGCEFHPFSDMLRISGSIVEGPQDISGHHTFNVDPGTVLDLEYPMDCSETLPFLEEAEKGAGSFPALAVSMDDETAEVFRIRDYGLEGIGKIRAKGGGKWTGKNEGWDQYYLEICDLVEQNLHENTVVLLSGPGFFKESLAKLLRERTGIEGNRLQLLQSSSGGISGLREALGKGTSANKVLEGLRFVRENELIEELMTRIGKGKGAAYGTEEVVNALSKGAVEVLLISERLFREGTGKEMMARASEMGSISMVVSTVHDLGKMLDKMGGIGALLRFEL
jgi:protein pelota